MNRILPGLLIGLFLSINTLTAQRVAVKTNLLYWATTTPNLGVEAAPGRKITLNLTGAYNPWIFGSTEDNKKIQHWIIRPEVRFWPYEKFDGHFLGVHGLFMSYNAGGIDIPLVPFTNLKDSRYEGYGGGVGFSYGYQFYLGHNWNLELSAGVGYVYYNYEQYECRKCGDFIDRSHKHWFGPTNVGVSFVYLFKSRRY